MTHVFNYHIPFESESYVHRIGRTGRANKDGVAMMLVTPHELRELKRIQKDVGSELTPQAIGDKNTNIKEKTESIVKMVAQEKENSDAQTILAQLLKDNTLEVVSLKILSLLGKTLSGSSSIGKTEKEIEQLLLHIDDDVQSESKKSSQRYKSRSSSSSARSSSRSSAPRRRRDDSVIRRGTERGEVPEPTVKSTGGGSRIVARKLF